MLPGDSTLPSEFGSLVRTYRREAGLTQRELAAKAGLSLAALRDFEQCRRCRPRPHSLAALTAALGLNPERTAGLVRAAALPRRRGAVSAPRPPLDDVDFARGVPSPLQGMGLWLSVLGPLEAWGDGTPMYL